MLRNTLKRKARADFLKRLENSARTVDEFEEVVDMYDKLDANRERRERYHEISQADYTVQYAGSKQKGYKLTFTETRQAEKSYGELQEAEPAWCIGKPKKYQKKESSKNHVYNEGIVIPPPILHPYWRELMRGDFISYIFDNCWEIWQVFGDWQVGKLYLAGLTDKQKEALFLSAVRLATSEQIGCYTDKSDRAVRRLIADALKNIRRPLALMIQNRIDMGLPITSDKRKFVEWWYTEQSETNVKKLPPNTPGK